MTATSFLYKKDWGISDTKIRKAKINVKRFIRNQTPEKQKQLIEYIKTIKNPRPNWPAKAKSTVHNPWPNKAGKNGDIANKKIAGIIGFNRKSRLNLLANLGI